MIPSVRSSKFLPCRRALQPSVLAWAAYFFLALALRGAQAQTFDATGKPQPIYIEATWLVHAGDDPAYARPDFDDAQWTAFDPQSPALHPSSETRRNLYARPSERHLIAKSF